MSIAVNQWIFSHTDQETRGFLLKVFDEWVGAMPSSVRSFINACKNDTETVVNAKEGLRSTAILDAIHKSLASGKPEKIQLKLWRS